MVATEPKQQDGAIAGLGDQGMRIAQIQERRRPGIFALMSADLHANFLQSRWRRLSDHAPLLRPWHALVFALRFDTLWAAWAYRVKRFCLRWHVPVVPRLLDRFLAAFYQVQIGDHVYIGPGLYIPHGFVVIDGFVEIGRNCVISPFVTLGLRNSRESGFSFLGPSAGDGLWIGSHSTVLGDISIGDHTSIGANSLVLDDLPGYCTAAGSPASVIRRLDPEEIEKLTANQGAG